MQRTPRLACLEDGDAAALARLLAEGDWDLSQPLVTQPDRTPLHVAAECGHLECVRLLLEAGADPLLMSIDNVDALSSAVLAGHAHLIRPLLEGGSLGIHELRGKVTPAARRAMGAPDNLPEDQCQGQTLLALAAGKNQVECLKVLLELGADINAPNPGNNTRPVQSAALGGPAEALAFLADRGANLAVKDKLGMTVLHYCCSHGYAVWKGQLACPPNNCPHAKCLRALFSRNFCLGLLESTSGNGYTPLMTACMHAHVAPTRVLLANGAAVDGADPALAAPLAEACAAGCPELVELLLDNGARYPALPVKDGRASPLQAALLEPMQSDLVPWGRSTPSHLRCAEIMLERGVCSGAEKTTQGGLDIYNVGALVRFNDTKSADAIRLLLRHGAPVHGPGGVLIYFAARRGYTAAVEALLEHGALLQPPRRADNALIWAAAQPEACTLILQASRRLSREERLRLYLAPVPPGMPLPEAVTQPPGKPTWQAVQDACGDRKCVKLLRQCLNEVGLEAEVTLPPRAPKQQPSVQQQFPSLARMAESAAPEAAAGSGSAGAAGGNRHSGSHAAAFTTTSTGSRGEISHTITADLSDLFAISRQMDAQFERRHREVPHLVYGAIFDCNWRSLSPAKLQAEVRRVLQPLRGSSASSAADLQGVFAFLSNAVYSSKLRGVMMEEDLPGLLAGVLTPEAAKLHSLRWHETAVTVLNTLLNTEASKFGKHGPAVACYLWALLHRCMPASSAPAAAATELDPFPCLCLAQCLKNLGGPGGVPQVLAMCPEGEETGCILVLRACACAMAKQAQGDQTSVMTALKVLKELRVFGIHDMSAPPTKDLLYRCTLARELFTQPCLLGTALQCLKGLALELQQAPLAACFLQDLMPLLACCAVEARRYGLVRLMMDGLASPSVELANGLLSVLYMLIHYADPETVDCFARAGLLPALEARLGQLLAGGTSAPALAAAVAAQTSRNNAVLTNTLAMCVGIGAQRTNELAVQAVNGRAITKAADLLKAIAAAFGEQPQQSIWSALCRQVGFLLLALCDSPAVARHAVDELGLHSTLAEVLPRVHLSVAPNLLGLWAKLLQHAGGRIVADMRAQGMPTAASFAGSTQPMMVVMRCLERLSSQPQLAHVAGGVLALTLRVLEGHPVNWANVKLGGGSPHPIFGKQRIDEETVQLLGGSTCACCGVVVGTTGAPLKRCSRCKAVAYCDAACQARHWKHWHKAACAPA